MEKEAFYFPHFSNARHDRKIKRLTKELGIEGYGIYFMLLEVLRDQENYRYPLVDIDLLADEFGTSEQKTRVVITNYTLFEIDEKEKFFSPKLLVYMQPYLAMKEQRRLAGIASGNKRKKLAEISAETEQPFNGRSTVDEQRKGKERKRKEKKIEIFNPFSLCPDWVNPDDWKDLVNHRKSHPKKPVESERAYRAIINQLKIAADNGITVKECIDKTIMSSWQSFEASWLMRSQMNKPLHDPTYGTGKRFQEIK